MLKKVDFNKSDSQYFNPYHLFVGSFLPNWLLSRPEVSPGAKLCYARLARFAGKDGECYPRQDTIASELGLSERQIRRYLKELVSFKLIEIEQLGLTQANRYFFLKSPWMNQFLSDQERTHVSGQDRTYMSGQERTDVSGHIYKDEESHLKDKNSIEQNSVEKCNSVEKEEREKEKEREKEEREKDTATQKPVAVSKKSKKPKDAANPNVQVFLKYAVAFIKEYGVPPEFVSFDLLPSWGKDSAGVKRLLSSGISLDELKRRWMVFVFRPDQWQWNKDMGINMSLFISAAVQTKLAQGIASGKVDWCSCGLPKVVKSTRNFQTGELAEVLECKKCCLTTLK